MSLIVVPCKDDLYQVASFYIPPIKSISYMIDNPENKNFKIYLVTDAGEEKNMFKIADKSVTIESTYNQSLTFKEINYPQWDFDQLPPIRCYLKIYEDRLIVDDLKVAYLINEQ